MGLRQVENLFLHTYVHTGWNWGGTLFCVPPHLFGWRGGTRVGLGGWRGTAPPPCMHFQEPQIQASGTWSVTRTGRNIIWAKEDWNTLGLPQIVLLKIWDQRPWNSIHKFQPHAQQNNLEVVFCNDWEAYNRHHLPLWRKSNISKYFLNVPFWQEKLIHVSEKL